MFDRSHRFLQISFNSNLEKSLEFIRSLPHHKGLWIEVGQSLIKREGIRAVEQFRKAWTGTLIADLKIIDGVSQEIQMAREAGANGVTILAAAPIESVVLAIEAAKTAEFLSILDFIGDIDPLKRFLELRRRPDVLMLRQSREGEGVSSRPIPYNKIPQIRAFHPELVVCVAGRAGLQNARISFSHGASIAGAHMVFPGDPWGGLPANPVGVSELRSQLAG